MKQRYRELELELRRRITELLTYNNAEVEQRREAERHRAVLRLEVTKLNRTIARKNRRINSLRKKLGDVIRASDRSEEGLRSVGHAREIADGIQDTKDAARTIAGLDLPAPPRTAVGGV